MIRAKNRAQVGFMTLILLVILAGCGGGDGQNTETNTELTAEEREKQQQIELFDEVMAIHDEVMPKMQDVYNLKVSLNGKLDSIPNLSEEDRDMLKIHILSLDNADEAMMNWMREFEPVPDTVTHEVAMEYLEEQKTKIEEVREVMQHAIKSAEEELKN